MKRVLGVISILLLMINILGLCACGSKKEKIDFENYNTLFIDTFSNEDDVNEKRIKSLRVYYYNTRYFYDVCYEKNDSEDNKTINVLFVFRYYSLKKFFNIENEQECYKYFSDYYELFLEAKEKGVKKEYSEYEIKQLIEQFYDITLE